MSSFLSRSALKVRRWMLGSRLRDKLWLNKSSLRHHLNRCGASLRWTGDPITVGLNFKNRRLSIACRDELSDAAVISEIFAEQQYRWVSKVSGIKTIIDLGANIGVFALYAHRFHPEAHLWCVEPDPRNLEMLRENERRNSLAASIIAGAVVGKAEPGEQVQLLLSESRTSNVVRRQEGDERTISVEAVSLRSLIDQAGGEADLIKCDIEGAEGELFRSVEPETLRRIRRLIVEYHSQALLAELMGTFAATHTLVQDTLINEEQGVMCFALKNGATL